MIINIQAHYASFVSAILTHTAVHVAARVPQRKLVLAACCRPEDHNSNEQGKEIVPVSLLLINTIIITAGLWYQGFIHHKFMKNSKLVSNRMEAQLHSTVSQAPSKHMPGKLETASWLLSGTGLKTKVFPRNTGQTARIVRIEALMGRDRNGL